MTTAEIKAEMLDLSLSSRLRNCLVTILELEETLNKSPLGLVLQDEFATLKEVAMRLENVSVEEDDVCRIESATVRFLAELKDTLEATTSLNTSASRLLQ